MRHRWINLTLLAIFSLMSAILCPEESWASLRVSAGFGFGTTTTSDEISESEGPLTQLYSVEYMYHSKIVLGAEHLRSLSISPISTAISFIGLFGKYYLNSAPMAYMSANDIDGDRIIIRDICYFVGGGVGLTQSNLRPDENNKSSNAAGVYISPRGGAEFSLSKRLGVSAEVMVGTSVFGAGSINSVSIVGSIFYMF